MKLENLTNEGAKRRYDDACGLAHALDLIGERWAMLILRELAYGPRRFSELKSDLPGISANVLTQRLTELEQRGIVRKRTLPAPASVQVYEATEWGLEAAPIVGALGKWAARSPLHDPTLPMSHSALIMSFETLFDPGRAGDMDADVGFRFARASYVVSIRDGRISVQRREPHHVDAIFTGEPTNIVAVIHGRVDPALVGVTIDGDAAVAKRFAGLFPLPAKVGES